MKVAWHDCLKPIAPPKPPADLAPAMFQKGKDIHYRIEAIVGEQQFVEQEMTFSEAQLPFEIAYHPDIIRQELGVQGYISTRVYEIKPLIWFLKNRVYCEAQASGYMHFTGSQTGDFILYQGDLDNLQLSVLPVQRIPWDWLRNIALRSYQETLTKQVANPT